MTTTKTILAAAVVALAAACAQPNPATDSAISEGRITKVVPVIIESNEPPTVGSALKPKTENRPGSRVTLHMSNGQLIEIVQDEHPSFKVGARVTVRGVGTRARIVTQ
jgi:outer membrane lipoprotein SlyB